VLVWIVGRAVNDVRQAADHLTSRTFPPRGCCTCPDRPGTSSEERTIGNQRDLPHQAVLSGGPPREACRSPVRPDTSRSRRNGRHSVSDRNGSHDGQRLSSIRKAVKMHVVYLARMLSRSRSPAPITRSSSSTSSEGLSVFRRKAEAPLGSAAFRTRRSEPEYSTTLVFGDDPRI